jgi:hypothetical protein
MQQLAFRVSTRTRTRRRRQELVVHLLLGTLSGSTTAAMYVLLSFFYMVVRPTKTKPGRLPLSRVSLAP